MSNVRTAATDKAFEKPLFGLVDMESVRTRLPDKYLSPLPIYAPPNTPVREFNTGRVMRSSGVLGLNRVLCGKGIKFFVRIGSYVEFEEDDGSLCYGRVVAVYVSYKVKTLAVSLRRFLTNQEIESKHSIAPPLGLCDGFKDNVWETVEICEHVSLERVVRLCAAVEFTPAVFSSSKQPDPPSSDSVAVVGHFCLGEEGRSPFSVWHYPSTKSEQGLQGETGNFHSLPVCNLGLVVWGDDFQQWAHRVLSTTNVAFSVSSLPFPLRMSGAWIRVVSCVPSGADEMEALRIILWPLLQMEKGVVVPADVDGSQVLLKVGVQAGLSDTPFQGKMAYCIANPKAEMYCHCCYRGNSANCDCDEVIIHSD